MIRKIIRINEEACNGCGACADACHEGAIAMVDGKAKLMREDYCDGLGDCLPACPTNAISFEMREAPAYDAAAVAAAQKTKASPCSNGGCPGTAARTVAASPVAEAKEVPIPSCLRQWPVQIKLAPVQAPFYDGAKLLIAADCSAYTYGAFHKDFMDGKITLIGCPKLDGVDYSEKLTSILALNNITSVTVVRMEVPCCGGLEQAVITALKNCGKFLPWQVMALSTNGKILDK